LSESEIEAGFIVQWRGGSGDLPNSEKQQWQADLPVKSGVYPIKYIGLPTPDRLQGHSLSYGPAKKGD
jgi:hypothetical protein